MLSQSHPRQFFYLVSWFLAAERMRRKHKPVEITEEGNMSFGLVAAVLNQETLILLKKSMMEWYDLKVWFSLPPTSPCSC